MLSRFSHADGALKPQICIGLDCLVFSIPTKKELSGWNMSCRIKKYRKKCRIKAKVSVPLADIRQWGSTTAINDQWWNRLTIASTAAGRPVLVSKKPAYNDQAAEGNRGSEGGRSGVQGPEQRVLFYGHGRSRRWNHISGTIQWWCWMWMLTLGFQWSLIDDHKLLYIYIYIYICIYLCIYIFSFNPSIDASF